MSSRKNSVLFVSLAASSLLFYSLMKLLNKADKKQVKNDISQDHINEESTDQKSIYCFVF